MTQPIIRFQGVSKAFGIQTVLRDFSLDVEPGAFVSIIGRSGCGKTTVLKLVNGLLSPDTGRVLIQGQDRHDLIQQHLVHVAQDGVVMHAVAHDVVAGQVCAQNKAGVGAVQDTYLALLVRAHIRGNKYLI